MKKIQDFQNFQKKRRRKFSKKGLGTKGIRLVLLRLLSKKKIINQNFQFHEKIQDSKFFKKKKKEKKNQNFQFLRKIQVFEIQKKNLH